MSGDNIGDAGDHQLDEIPRGSHILDHFGNNLTQAAREHKLDPVVGREAEMERLMQILVRRAKNRPVLIGEPGVNKADVVVQLAQSIVMDEVPRIIKDKQIYSLDPTRLMGASGNDFDESLLKIVTEISGRGDVILFIDEIHTLVDEATTETAIRAAAGTVLSALMEVETPLIGATTIDDYQMHIEKIPALQQEFERIEVDELSVPACVEHLKGMRDRLEAHHRMQVTDGALIAAAELAHRYIRHQLLPNSSIQLIDEAGARLRVRIPLELKEKKIASVRQQKERAIDTQDFTAAAALRDKEQKLSSERNDIKLQFGSGALLQEPSSIDENEIIDVVSDLYGVPVRKLRGTLSIDRAFEQPAYSSLDDEVAKFYTLLGDQPITKPEYDLLGSGRIADSIAAILNDSRASSPFVMAIDGGWGTGKSTLLNQIESRLSQIEGIGIVRFNAWTSQGHDTLEMLIRSVLTELDPKFLRRWASKLAGRQRMLSFVRIFLTTVARFFGAGRMIDEIWKQIEANAKDGNDLRSVIFDMLSEWTEGDEGEPGKSLVVFIDDLDRCSESIIVQVCEAVKLYLEAPGIIFVIGCDLAVLTQGVSTLGYGKESLTYLEKIIQVVYRIHPPDDEHVKRLIRGYAEVSGTNKLIDRNVEEILSERTRRNPRRIKRVINSFILESHLRPTWESPLLGNDQLVTAVILQHLYPEFFEELTGERGGEDPIGEFLDYADVKARIGNLPQVNDAWWSTTSKLFRQHGILPPSRTTMEDEKVASSIARLEGDLPTEYPRLARDQALLSLLREVGDEQSRVALRSHLLNYPLRTETIAEPAE